MGIDIQEREQLAAAEDVGIDVPFDDENGVQQMQADGVTPILVHVTGMLSKRYQASQHVQRGRIVKKAMAELMETPPNGTGKPASTDSGGSGFTAWPEDLRELEEEGRRSIESQRETVAMCITGWTPGFTSGGQPFDFSHENAIRLLKAFPHFQRKLEKAMASHDRFFAPASNN